MGVILGLLAALLWGFGDLLARFAGQAIGAWRTLFYSELAGVLFLTGWLVLSTGGGPPVPELTASTWAVGLLAALLHLLGAYALTQALTIGTISLVMPIASSYGAVSAVLSILSGEPVTPTAMLGIAITVVGVALAGQAQSDKSKRTTAGVGWALVAAGGFGVAFWVQGAMLVPAIGSLPSVWMFLAFGVLAMGSASLFGFGSLAFPPKEAISVTFGSGSLAVGAYIAVALGFATGQIAIVAVLSTLSSVITAILGYFVLGERLSARQIVGVVLIIVGVVIINVA
jgi:drug/metabolite transporter (DMT)-like permease